MNNETLTLGRCGMVTVAERRAELRYNIKRLVHSQRQYETTALWCARKLEGLDADDVETPDAARQLMQQWIHADNCAAEAGRYLDRARGELHDLNEKARAA